MGGRSLTHTEETLIKSLFSEKLRKSSLFVESTATLTWCSKKIIQILLNNCVKVQQSLVRLYDVIKSPLTGHYNIKNDLLTPEE